MSLSVSEEESEGDDTNCILVFFEDEGIFFFGNLLEERVLGG